MPPDSQDVNSPDSTAPAPIQKGGRWRSSGVRSENEQLWPRDSEWPLLRALVGPAEEAAHEWRTWCESGGLMKPDPRVHQLLATCFHLRERLEPNEQELDLLKKVYLQSWAKNQRLRIRLAAILDRLEKAGCQTLILKGAALATRHYQDLGARSMGDVDVLVPEDRFCSAYEALIEDGWRPLHYQPSLFDTRFCHALPLLDHKQDSVDLHCHVISQSCEPGADDLFWQAAVPFEVEGIECLTLCDSDHLMHACAHGVWWVQHPPLRWIVDAVMILNSNSADGIDWQRVSQQAAARGVGLRVGMALRLLSQIGTAVPPQVADELISGASRLERRRLRLATSNLRGRPAELLETHWMMYRRGLKDRGELGKLAGFPAYLRFSTQTGSLLKVPLVVAEKSFKSVAHRLGFYQYWNTD